MNLVFCNWQGSQSVHCPQRTPGGALLLWISDVAQLPSQVLCSHVLLKAVSGSGEASQPTQSHHRSGLRLIS